MNLLQNIKNKRIQQRKKQPFERDLYTKISTLVRTHGLDSRFLIKLDNTNDYLEGKTFDVLPVKTKAPVEFPLFSLSTQDEYDIASAIISKVNNPYLAFAQSPKEILLCAALYRTNSSLPAERLRYCDFETLLLYEMAKKHVRNLMERLTDIRKKTGPDAKAEKDETNPSQINRLQKQIKQLQYFIAKFENAGKAFKK